MLKNNCEDNTDGKTRHLQTWAGAGGAQKLSSLAEEGSGGLKYSEAAEVTKYEMIQEAISGLLPNILV